MKIINKTANIINLLDKNEKIIKIFLPDGKPAQCKIYNEKIDSLKINEFEININSLMMGEVDNLPDPDGNIYIVSITVAKTLPLRNDLIIPDQIVKDKNGVIKGCKAFAKI